MCYQAGIDEGPTIQNEDADELRQIASDIMMSSERLERIAKRTHPSLMRMKLERAKTSIQLSVCDIHQYCR